MSMTRKINWDDYKTRLQVRTPEEFNKEYLCDFSSGDVTEDRRSDSAIDFPRSAVLEDFLVPKRGG
jgi:hypothetical protein